MYTLAENTYSAYQAGEINNSDLVDPYVLASQQSPGDDFQGWAAAQLTLLGTNSPENFDQIGSFNVTTESGTQYEGVLFSQENPASGQFENGTTYNTSNIGGTQYVVTSDRIVELDGEFTIDSISTQDGQTVQNVTIQKTTYETTNVTELKQQYEDLAYKRAQIEAREKALKQSAGGGFLGGGSVPPVVALAVIGTLLAIVVLQN
ncbi:unknown [Haloarcula marismortui ATCC 43049]|nr:unknown [Haloarcula marismortui ATCC 43049]